MVDFLINDCSETKMSMIGYILENTLSENGTVNRGVCKVDKNRNLSEVNERIKLARQNGKVQYNIGSDEPSGEVDPKSYVSMNYWGFHPSIFGEIEKGLHQFMKENADHPILFYIAIVGFNSSHSFKRLQLCSLFWVIQQIVIIFK